MKKKGNIKRVKGVKKQKEYSSEYIIISITSKYTKNTELAPHVICILSPTLICHIPAQEANDLISDKADQNGVRGRRQTVWFSRQSIVWQTIDCLLNPTGPVACRGLRD